MPPDGIHRPNQPTPPQPQLGRFSYPTARSRATLTGPCSICLALESMNLAPFLEGATTNNPVIVAIVYLKNI